MVGLFLLLGYRDAMSLGALLGCAHTVIPGDLLNVFAPLCSRRRRLDGLARWPAAHLRPDRDHPTAALAGPAYQLGRGYAWAMVAYVVCVAILYGLTA